MPCLVLCFLCWVRRSSGASCFPRAVKAKSGYRLRAFASGRRYFSLAAWAPPGSPASTSFTAPATAPLAYCVADCGGGHCGSGCGARVAVRGVRLPRSVPLALRPLMHEYSSSSRGVWHECAPGSVVSGMSLRLGVSSGCVGMRFRRPCCQGVLARVCASCYLPGGVGTGSANTS